MSRLTALLSARDESELRVVVFGEFNHGKSTLINCAARPGTALVVRNPHDRSHHARRPRRNGRNYRPVHGRPVGDDRPRHLDELSSLDAEGQSRSDIDLLTVISPTGIVGRGLSLIDTPGTNDDPIQTRRATRALHMADAVIWMLHADHCLRECDRGFAADWFENCPDAPVLPVLNFMNLLDDDERQSVRERAEQILNERFGELVGPIRNVLGKPYFEINAKGVLNHLTRGGKNPRGDFELLKSVLFDLAGPYRLALQSRVRSHRLQAAIAPLRDQNRDALRPLRESAEATKRLAESRRRDLQTEIRRFAENSARSWIALKASAARILDRKLRRLLGKKLAGATLARIRANTDDWCDRKMSSALAKIAEEANAAMRRLSEEYSLPGQDLLKPRWRDADFDVDLPNASGSDEFWSFLGSTPAADYLNKLKRNLREEWEDEASSVMSALQSRWDERIKSFQCVLEARANCQPAITIPDDLIRVKALELCAARCRAQWRGPVGLAGSYPHPLVTNQRWRATLERTAPARVARSCARSARGKFRGRLEGGDT